MISFVSIRRESRTEKKIISIENHMCVVFSITVAVQPVEMIFYEYLKIDFLTASERNTL